MQTVSNPRRQWAYVIGPYSEPVASVKPSDRFTVETADAFENTLYSVVAKFPKRYLPPRPGR